VVATVSLGEFAGYLGLNPNTNKIFVERGSDQVYSGNVTVIDGNSNSIVGTIMLNRSSFGGIAANPVTNMIYIGSMYSDSVAVVSGSTLSLVSEIPVGTYPDKVAVNPVTNTIYATNFYDDTVSVISGGTNQVIATVPITGYHPGFAGMYPYGVSVDTKSNRVYVADVAGNAVSIIDGNTNNVTSTVSLVDTSTNQTASNPQYVSANPNTGQVYITVYGNSLATVHYGTTLQPTSTTVTINSVDSSNNSPLNGYYATLSENGAVTKTGFTPVPFTVTIGQTYTVEVQDFGGYYFSHWSDTGSTSRDRTITSTSSAQSFTAVYSTSQSSRGGGGSGNGGGSSSDGVQSAISVTTVNSSGDPITGYYISIWQNTTQIDSAFSPASLAVNSGQTFEVAVSDYGNYVFDHWSDGTTDRFHTVTAGSGTTTALTAVYKLLASTS
jgi:YVTN family beta-propeller protein